MVDLLVTQKLADVVGVKPRRLLAIAKTRGVEPAMRVGRSCLWNRTDAERLTPGKRGRPRKDS